VKLPLVRSTLLDRPSSDAAFLDITRKSSVVGNRETS
jgi:hypothetical protein